ncbi:MAG TPA: AAA family ATPase [Actinomycetota bacterium]|jgi:aminoglycoside phosphotransferase family enzyme/cytidylate kinase|nr:AAA family ATPase [Actinomycetota bacterium]
MIDSRIVETHISVLFFVGDRVYKLKKPVRFDFIDLSTREARERICHREVELNRRLSPDVYLGVLDVVDGDGTKIDHIVEMRRMPEERKLSALVASGRDVRECLRSLAREIAAFHAAAATSEDIDSAGRWTSVRRAWNQNLAEMERFAGPIVNREALERADEMAHRYLDGRRPLFEHRVAQRCIRDGHGDLLSDDIFCMDDGPRVLDCIEFDDRLRYGDVLADVAFLAMDLQRLGAAPEARYFLDLYREFSGETYPQSLVHHYIAGRALVRSKVACLSYEQGNEAKDIEASTLLEMAVQHLDEARIRLVLVGGLPGTGKSTLAAGLSDATGWALLRSDEVRKDLAGMGHAERAAAEFRRGVYSNEMTERTYDALLQRTRALLQHGESVIVDASWLRTEHREKGGELAREISTDLYQLRCVLDADEAAQRIRARTRDVSDADERIAAIMAARADPWADATEIETDSSPKECVKRALAATSLSLSAAR